MDKNKKIDIDYDETMKQMKEDIISKNHYVHIELLIAEDSEQPISTIKLRNISGETYGKAMLAVKQILSTLTENANEVAILYYLTHKTEDTIIYPKNVENE